MHNKNGEKMHNIRFIFLFIVFITNCARAAAPSESCPAGYMTIKTNYIVLSDGACPRAQYELARRNHVC